MKVYIIGVSGMLGSTLFLNFINKRNFEIKGSVRSKKNKYFSKYTENIDLNIDVKNFKNLKKKILEFKPDYVVNCVGWVKQKKSKKKNLLYLNSLFPHKLNNFLDNKKIKLVHFSTDCVFNGKKGNHEITDNPDATDLYGRSKIRGEVISKNCLTVRTSIIGHELNTSNGLLEWFLKEKFSCSGYSNAFFTGLTTYEVYRFLSKLFYSKKKPSGIYQLSSAKISKFKLLNIIKKIYNSDVLILKNDKIKINRSLSNNLSLNKFKFVTRDWNKMIKEMKSNKKKLMKS